MIRGPPKGVVREGRRTRKLKIQIKWQTRGRRNRGSQIYVKSDGWKKRGEGRRTKWLIASHGTRALKDISPLFFPRRNEGKHIRMQNWAFTIAIQGTSYESLNLFSISSELRSFNLWERGLNRFGYEVENSHKRKIEIQETKKKRKE